MQRVDTRLAASYVRGALDDLPSSLREKPLDALTEDERAFLVDMGRGRGLKIHYFKIKEDLPRVRLVMGFLRGIYPESVLDVGSGRGVFLFPFLREFPYTPITSLDILDYRVDLLAALSRGGIDQLTAVRASICDWDAPDGSFDVVTLLEVLEHIPAVEAAIQNAVRLARRYVVVTVPSKPDDNPEHIHLLTKDILTDMFTKAGCRRLRFDGVPGHLFMIADVGGK